MLFDLPQLTQFISTRVFLHVECLLVSVQFAVCRGETFTVNLFEWSREDRTVARSKERIKRLESVRRQKWKLQKPIKLAHCLKVAQASEGSEFCDSLYQ